MRPASITSPFSSHDNNDDWVHWRKDQPLSSLQGGIQTESRFSASDEKPSEHVELPPDAPPYIMPIRRPQYNAVLDRFSNARKRSGVFSAWTT